MIFRSLKQDDVKGQIRSEIIRTLQNPQVVYWYEKANPMNSFEKKVREKLLQGNLDMVIELYKQELKKRKHSYMSTI